MGFAGGLIVQPPFRLEARSLARHPSPLIRPFSAPNVCGLFLLSGATSHSFRSILGEQGEIHFPHAYAAPPNVELTGSRKTLVVECKATGFKWKNAGKNVEDEGEVTWVAKGVKAK